MKSTSTRRQVIAASAIFPLLERRSPARSPRPNILWITCEDLSPILGCYGDRYAYTPNLDRLSVEGARYTRAFSAASVCAPARSSLITGVQANTLGTMRLRGVVPLADAAPAVRFAGAEALATEELESEVMPTLSACLLDTEPRVALQAAIALWYLGEKARPVVETMRLALSVEGGPSVQRTYTRNAVRKTLLRLGVELESSGI